MQKLFLQNMGLRESSLYANLHCCDIRIQEAVDIKLADEEKVQAFVIRDDEPYLVIGNGKTFLNSIPYEEGWLPPEK
ncbi:hypothetical protein ACIQXV_21860 [Neobacillus sp. NPDC097160]|uniref:hypothetical protein n=1 Tax=Neobacillus sp. NPDC097160 TaxID=3364298 RepID=UPI0037FCE82D